MNISKFGKLYVIATPIGHLQDVTLRALTILRSVDLIAAEDTRHSKNFLTSHGIGKPLKSLHEFNETQQKDFFLQQLKNGLDIALISDAGTPLIQDPGYELIREAQIQGIVISPIPGPCALIAALSVSGLPTHRFTFIGFLPLKKIARQIEFEKLLYVSHTLIFYEAPHRLLQLINEIILYFGGERKICIAHELTKIHESIHTGTANEILDYFVLNKEKQQGEFVVLCSGSEKQIITQDNEIIRILKILLEKHPLKEAVRIVADITKDAKNKIYKIALELNRK